jgi:uncharacterized protein YaiE (UPF0345 family)
MSIAISRDTLETVLLPGGSDSPDAIDKLIQCITGALAISIDEDDSWHVLVQVGETFKWLNVEECVPSDSSREYSEPTKVTSLSAAKPRNTP